MADEKIGVLERLSHALVSGNLVLRSGVSDLDYVMALGMAAKAIGGMSSVLRLHLAATPETYREARRKTIQIARRKSERKKWGMKNRELIAVAEIALHHYICPVCPECVGRRFTVAKDTPRLTNKVCRRCRGSGVRPLPIHHGRQIAEIIYALQGVEPAAEYEIRKRLRCA